ncbi:LysE family translocator [Methylovirgula sp. 4M-Z18]|uniref:LysE family translocator n=1 Tax=Methylovirgula sp. 4M-Z18 TaxID=2293567 RepID=UPI000E2F7799|nr:LysE family translocator [Methylovirgula sp. 4M-Z18]RFB80119.1 LysE family translocator [Methylovirgula sp. 4M-Z18]
MTYAQNLWLFFVLLVGIIIVPGMDMLLVLSSALTGGRKAGLSVTAGLMAGGACHTLFGLAGVSVLLAAAPSVFTVLLLAGALYMAWIGLTLIRSSITVGVEAGAQHMSLVHGFRRGLMTCLLNPKAYLFVIAVFPQFLSPQYGPLWPQAIVMGLMTMLTQGAVYGSVALVAGSSRDFLVGSPGITILAGRLAGILFILVAGLTAWHGWTAA